MPSSNLEQLEIMTNPPAKYDASGNAGVINIRTKKQKLLALMVQHLLIIVKEFIQKPINP
jgi:outer membrane receptor for monomeric catechols